MRCICFPGGIEQSFVNLEQENLTTLAASRPFPIPTALFKAKLIDPSVRPVWDREINLFSEKFSSVDIVNMRYPAFILIESPPWSSQKQLTTKDTRIISIHSSKQPISKHYCSGERFMMIIACNMVMWEGYPTVIIAKWQELKERASRCNCNNSRNMGEMR